jgi:hypothetical protein
VSGFSQRADFIHHLALIAKIEACSWLVEHTQSARQAQVSDRSPISGPTPPHRTVA